MFGVDVRALAALRVGFALILIFDLINRARSLVAHYTDLGAVPRSEAMNYLYQPVLHQIHFLSGSWQFEALLFVIAFAFALMLLIGYRTRIAIVGSVLLLISLFNRNYLVLQGGDYLLLLSLFWMMFLPIHAAYSLDAIRERYKLKTTLIASGASACLLMQIALVYLFAFLHKLPGTSWMFDFSAIHRALMLDIFVTPIGHTLLSFPSVLPYMTMGVMFLEGIIFFILFSPFFTRTARTIGFVLIASLFLGMGLSLRLGPFPFVSVTAALAFLPSPVWDALSRFISKREKKGLTLYYDSECGFCRTAAHAIPQFLLLQSIEVRPAPEERGIQRDMFSENSWVCENARGERLFRFDVFVEMVRSSGIFFFAAPIMKCTPVRYVGTLVYRFVARRRSRTCVPDAKLPVEKSELVPETFPVRFITLSIMIIIVCWNIATLWPAKFRMSPGLTRVVYALGVSQRWDMFAPNPLPNDGWYVIPATRVDGMEIDLFQHGKVVSWDKPEMSSRLYDGERWRKYLQNISNGGLPETANYYAKYLCRSWNQSHTGSDKILDIKVIFVHERTREGHLYPDAPEPQTLAEAVCS